MNKIIYAFFIILMASCASKNAEPKEDATQLETSLLVLTDAQLKQAELEISSASIKTLHETIQVNGLVDVPPQNMVSVSFPLGGYLKKTKLLPGMSVKKGEVIALMEDQSYVQLQQDYLIDKVKMEFLPDVALPGMVSVVPEIDPAPTSNVELTTALGEFSVIAPVTASEFVPLKISPFATLAALIARLRQAPLATLRVTVTPELIVTASVDVGVAALPATPPTVVAQIEPFQLPVVTANRWALATLEKNNEPNIIKVTLNNKAVFFLFNVM